MQKLRAAEVQNTKQETEQSSLFSVIIVQITASLVLSGLLFTNKLLLYPRLPLQVHSLCPDLPLKMQMYVWPSCKAEHALSYFIFLISQNMADR